MSFELKKSYNVHTTSKIQKKAVKKLSLKLFRKNIGKYSQNLRNQHKNNNNNNISYNKLASQTCGDEKQQDFDDS